MKKLLVVLLAVAMMFTFSATAFAYTDTADLDAASQDAITLTSALGIFGGYADGSFQPDGSLTRAEFAKLLTIAAGYEKSAGVLENTASTFNDVKTGVWYTGYVNVCETKGLLAGYPDGSFGPNKVVTEYEVLTGLMRLLGYTDAGLVGPWPTDYVMQATELNMLDEIDFFGSIEASREITALLVAVSLEANTVYFDKDLEEYADVKDDAKNEVPLLAKTFKGATVTGEVTNTSYDLFNEDNKTMTLKVGGKDITVNADTVIESGYNIVDLYKADLSIIANTKDNVTTAIYIGVNSDIVYTSAVTATTDGFKVDGTEYDSTFKGFTAEQPMYRVVITKGEVTSIKDDNFFVEYVGVIEKIAKDKVYYINGGSNDFTDMKSVEDYLIFKGGALVSVDELEEQDVVSKLTNASAANIYIVDSLVTGELTKLYSAEVAIDGTKVAFDNKNVYAAADYDSVNLEYKYVGTTVSYVYVLGQLEFVLVGDVAADTTTAYGVVTNATKVGSTAGSFGTVVEGNDNYNTVTITNTKGETVTYDIAKAFIGEYQVEIGDKAGKLVQLELNADGEVIGVVEARTGSATTATASAKYETLSFGDSVIYVDDAVVVFNLSEDKDDVLKVATSDKDGVLALDKFTLAALSDENYNNEAKTTIQYFIVDGEIVALALSDVNADEEVSGVKYGKVTEMGYLVATGTYGIVIDGVEYQYKAIDAAVKAGAVVSYKVTGDQLSEVTVLTIDNAAEVQKAYASYFKVDGTEYAYADVIVYVVAANGTYTLGSVDDIYAGAKVEVVVSKTVENAMTEAVLVFVEK